MKRTVFYSWQSDLPGPGNRNLIGDCLERALRAIGRDSTASVEPVLDRDTAGEAGTPDIAATILAKIALADVFVADVSIVNQGAGPRPMPNPNVLVELGYAAAELGWDKVLLVQNSAFGGPESLPFDLRGRRTVVYEAVGGFDRGTVRDGLQRSLQVALRHALVEEGVGTLPTGPDAGLWWGPWTCDRSSALTGELLIREVGPEGFLFDIQVSNGAHQAQMTAVARIVSRDLAYARVFNAEGEEPGELTFRRTNRSRRREIEVLESASCQYWRGFRATFSATFERRREPWFDAGLLNELDMSRLYGLTGKYLEDMRQSAAELSVVENLDDFEAKVVTSGAPGLYTVMETIIMFGGGGEMWCAMLDGDKVRYFTNMPEWMDKRPKTIEDWRSRFQDREVILEVRPAAMPSRQS